MASRDPLRPNVLFILTDDHGPWALGCAGNGEIRTPHLDALAGAGMRFENFFCTSPVCSPARASLLTGRIPSQHGIHDWISGGNAGPGAVEYLAGQTGYPELLAAAGYSCGISGKWHLGDSYRPQKGFTHWYVHEAGGGPYYNAPMIRNGALARDPRYVTDLITDDALEFIDAQAQQPDGPFYLSVHYTAPHSPYINNHPQDIVDSYAACPFESCPQEPRHPWVPAGVFGPAWQQPREHLQGYFAAVTAMDANVGRLRARLGRHALDASTLVLFLSDNGFNCGHHGIWGKGNGTFPLNMYDNSVKVPAIASQPGRIPRGTVCRALLSQYDVMPTLLDYLGLSLTHVARLPGRSFAPVLRGETGREHPFVVVCDEYGPVRMIRTADWKYVHRYPYGPNELYDLERDPGERRNLLTEGMEQDIAQALRAQLQEWFCRYADPARDGVREAVTGAGQRGLAGLAGRRAEAFAQRRRS